MSYIHRTKEAAPYIRLSGQYLRETGFAIGASFQVTTEPNRIILERIGQ